MTRAHFDEAARRWRAEADNGWTSTADEREAAFEERRCIGGFAFLTAFADLITNLEANALAAEFVRGKIP